jgi:Cu/Ag efflux protein CusF
MPFRACPELVEGHTVSTALSTAPLGAVALGLRPVQRRLNMLRKLNSFSPRITLFCLCALLAFSAACNRGPSQPGAARSSTAAKRYPFKGRVISIDKQAANANIENEPIAGFMDPMAMPYTIKPPVELDQLKPGDSVTADVVVEPDKYWLENVQVTGHWQTSADKPTTATEKNRRSK